MLFASLLLFLVYEGPVRCWCLPYCGCINFITVYTKFYQLVNLIKRNCFVIFVAVCVIIYLVFCAVLLCWSKLFWKIVLFIFLLTSDMRVHGESKISNKPLFFAKKKALNTDISNRLSQQISQAIDTFLKFASLTNNKKGWPWHSWVCQTIRGNKKKWAIACSRYGQGCNSNGRWWYAEFDCI